MAEDFIRYDILAQDALRGVVRKVLSEISRTGLPGEHHFYITFGTRASGVRVSSRLLTQYPEEMTIVLQHQFWDLTVTEHAFEVGLSFNGVPERLFVPFAAIKGFLDPSVQFGLQFETAPAPAVSAGEAPQDVAPVAVISAVPEAPEPAAEAGAEPEVPGPAAQVVSLDAFRKK